jgi:hypothetical protein
VRLAQNDAAQNGVTNQVIKYVVPPDITVPPAALEVFDDFAQNQGLIIDVVTSPLLR